MKKYLVISLAGFLILSGQASAAPSGAEKISKAFGELNKASTYHIFINNITSSNVKNIGKKNKNEGVFLNSFGGFISSKNISEIKVDKSDKNNEKIYLSSKIKGGLLSGMQMQGVKYGGYEYSNFGDSSKNEWTKTTSTFEETSNGLFFSSSSPSLVFTDKLIQKYKKNLKIVKVKDGVISGKLSDHYHIVVPVAIMKKVINEYANQQGIDLTVLNKNKSKTNFKSMALDVWLDKKTNKLTQNNILFSVYSKSVNNIFTITSLSEITFVSINDPVNIFQPVISNSSSTQQYQLNSPSTSVVVSSTSVK